MTTVPDEELLKECLGDADSLLDYDDCQIIDLDDINATIEDPGYILEEPLVIENKTEKYKSSYGKRSFTLPVTFFDISRNVKLLAKCRPISVKIVDCRIYPWYYKKVKREEKDICFDATDEDINGETNIDTDLINIQSDISSKTLSHFIDQSNAPKITISSEQSLVISKLKEDIVRINNMQIDKNTTVNIDRDITITELNTNKGVVENNTTKTIEDTDLLKYKAIAETIVRNIDMGDFDMESGDVQVMKEPEVSHSGSTCSRYNEPINARKANNVILNKDNKAEKTNDTIITSPILPCKIRSQKKTAKKRNDEKRKKITANKHYFENFNNCNGRLTSSANKVIPHSHYKVPMSTRTAANHVYYMNMNGMMSQYYATQRYLEQNEAISTYSQPISQVNYLTGNNHSNFVYNYQNLNSLEGHSSMEYKPNTCYDYNNAVYNLPREVFELSSAQKNLQVIMKSNVGNIKPTEPLNESPYDYVNSVIRQPSQVITEIGNKGNVSEKTVSRENQRIVSGIPTCGSSLVPHCLYPSKPHVNSTDLQFSKQTAAANVRNNPALMQILNKPIEPPINYSSSQYFNETNYVRSPNVMQNRIERNRKLTQDVNFDNSDVNIGKNIEKVVNVIKLKKVSESIFPGPNKKTDTNSILYAPITTSYSETDNYAAYNIVNDVHGLKSSVATSRQIIGENLPEFAKIKNSKPHFDYPYDVDKRDVDSKTLEQVPSNPKGYSPAILPIPTFEKSLQMLSEITNRENSLYDTTNIHDECKVGRKRQHVNDASTCRKSKKISLQEYKQRILGVEKVDSKNYVTKEITSSESLKSDNIKMHQECHQNVDAQDLGYDSDCTVVIDVQN